MSAMKKGGLGRGLDAIFMDNDIDGQSEVLKLRISEIEPNRNQPRKDFDDEALAELADSISQHGVLQPLLVRPMIGGNYQIVAGERRWRACRMAGVAEVPVVVRELTDSEVMELALIENLQRENLSVIEEALGYKTLMEDYDFTQDQVARSVGKSRSAVANTLRVLKLPSFVLDLLKRGEISAGHTRPILSLESDEDMERLAKIIVERGLSVRETERLAKRILKETTKEEKPKNIKRRDSFFDEVELSLMEFLGRKVIVNSNDEGKGILQIEFYDQEDLAQIARKLGSDD